MSAAPGFYEGSAWIFPSSFEEGCRRRRRGGVAARRMVDHPVALRAPPSLSKEGKKTPGARDARNRWLKDGE